MIHNFFELFFFYFAIVLVATPVTDRNTVETKVEVKNEFRQETKPVITSAVTQQSTHVPASTGEK